MVEWNCLRPTCVCCYTSLHPHQVADAKWTPLTYCQLYDMGFDPRTQYPSAVVEGSTFLLIRKGVGTRTHKSLYTQHPCKFIHTQGRMLQIQSNDEEIDVLSWDSGLTSMKWRGWRAAKELSKLSHVPIQCPGSVTLAFRAHHPQNQDRRTCLKKQTYLYVYTTTSYKAVTVMVWLGEPEKGTRCGRLDSSPNPVPSLENCSAFP